MPGSARHELVAALGACVAEWERLLAGPALSKNVELSSLVQRSQQLEAPSRSVGFGGVGHHLSELSRLVQASPDMQRAREQLGIVRELLLAARNSLPPAEAQDPARSLTPPPLLSGFLDKGASLPQGSRSAEPAVAPPRLLTAFGLKAPSIAPTPPPAIDAAPQAEAQRPLPVSAPPRAAIAAPAPAAEPAYAPVAPGPSRPGQPNLMVRSLLGLRAFGRKENTPAPVPPTGSSPPEMAGPPGLLGLNKPRGPSPSSPPRAVGGGYGGLSSLPAPLTGAAPFSRLPEDLSSRRGGPSGAHPARQPSRSPSSPAPAPARPRTGGGGRPRRRGESGEGRWWIGALAALGVCAVVLGIVLVAVMVTRRRDDPAAAGTNATASASAGTAAAVDSALPRSRLLTDDERLRSLLTQVHGRGGKESAELRALLDEQASLAVQALKPGCVGPQCAALAEVGKLVTNTTKKRVKRRSQSPDTMRSRWLAGLEMPEIPVEDDPRVQRRFEFYTENPLGRETFQQMLFRCGAYKDAIQSTLIRRGLPKDLIAVAYAESGCYPLAKSPAGAEGLWQFIPDAARAYHLRIIDGVVDERHSPQKSTDAAIQYFSDMYAKFGSWDLVFSAYNMGPFGLATRLEQVEGENVGFWELVDAQMLPGETADYAPAIQAIALILNNLSRLKFGAIQQRAPQMTMELPVPPGTRMTLIARAAALSHEELRRLNLDIKGTSTPNVQNFAVQVPKDSVWQARETLQELLKAKDDGDLCAPANFDWGRQRFTPAMQEACARGAGARAAADTAAAAAPGAAKPQQ